MIAELVGRDTAFYDARITKEAILGASAFAQSVGLITRRGSYEEVVVETLQPLSKL